MAMPFIEIQHQSEDVEVRPLSKTQPLSIGRHPSNDIVINEDGVANLHCRIIWSGESYEVAAATPTGVDVNGVFVMRTKLRVGDLLRIGTYDIILRSDAKGNPDSVQATSSGEIPLPKISQRKSQPPQAPPGPLPPGSKSPDRIQPPTRQSAPPQKTPERSKHSPPAETNWGQILGSDVFEEWESDEFQVDVEELPAARPSSSQPPRNALAEQIKARLGGRPARPGERDPIRSPLVLGLGGGGLALLLLAATVWFVIVRDMAERQYEAAVNEMDQGKYAQAITLFEDFLKNYPQHSNSESARIKLGESRILQAISGSTPAWPLGLEALEQFIRQHRDRSGFREQHDRIRRHAHAIALGAAQTAEVAQASEVTQRRQWLEISVQATAIFQRYSPEQRPPAEQQEQLRQAYLQAEAAILKQETLLSGVAEIEQAIQTKQPMAALKARRQLLQRYPEFASHDRLTGTLEKTLETERELVTGDKANHESQTTDPAHRQALSLVAQTRTRAGEVSANRAVLALAQDCCYAVDTITGDPIWRRVVGFDSPFFPLRVSTFVPGYLLFDTNQDALLLVERQTGRLIWRQPVEGRPSGPPLVQNRQVYLPTSAGKLYQIDLNIGRITAQLTLSQPLLAPPVPVPGEDRIVVAGDEELLYTVSARPLACQTVSYLGHKPGSIQAPLIPMRSLLLIAENDRAESCQLRVVDMLAGEQLQQVTSFRIQGQVRDRPILRGRQLFVPSGGQRITAFAVSEEDKQRTLTRIDSYAMNHPHPGPIHLWAGPEGQLFAAAGSLQKLRLSTKDIQLEPGQTAPGISTQPLQSAGSSLFVARRLPYSSGVILTPADRKQLTGQWRIVVGASLLACQETGENSAVCVTDAGHIFSISPDQFETRGFAFPTGNLVSADADFTDPLHAGILADGRIAVHCGPQQPRLWLIARDGQVQQEINLPEPLQADPILLGGHLALPLPGRIQLIDSDGSPSGVEDYLMPMGQDAPSRWSHLTLWNEAQILAVTGDGLFLKLELRQAPLPHLAEAGRLELGQPLDVPFVVHQNRIFLADAGGRLQELDASSANLEMLSEVRLDQPAANSLRLVEDMLLVETGRDTLRCFDIQNGLVPRWSIPLPDSALAGSPIAVQDNLILATRAGDVLALEPESGQIRRQLSLQQPIRLGLRMIGETIVVDTIDGSLHRVNSVLEAAE